VRARVLGCERVALKHDDNGATVVVKIVSQMLMDTVANMSKTRWAAKLVGLDDIGLVTNSEARGG
jgi:hypothetical protein